MLRSYVRYCRNDSYKKSKIIDIINDMDYQLFALGSSMGAKHATALVLQKNGEWTLFNDAITEDS